MKRYGFLRALFFPLILLGLATLFFSVLSADVPPVPVVLCLVLALAALAWLAFCQRPPPPDREQLILDGFASRWLLIMLAPTIALVVISERVHGLGPMVWAWTIPAGLALGAAAFRLGRLTTGRVFETVAAVLLLSLTFGYGGVVSLDTLLDRSQPRVQVVRITDMFYASTSHSQSTRVYFADAGGVRSMAISPWLYPRLHIGGEACLIHHRGALGLPWYEVQACA